MLRNISLGYGGGTHFKPAPWDGWTGIVAAGNRICDVGFLADASSSTLYYCQSLDRSVGVLTKHSFEAFELLLKIIKK